MQPVITEPTTEQPARDFRQRRIDHAEMLRTHRDLKQRRQDAHAKRRHIRSTIPITLV
jgi:hypothetical protein